VLLLLLLLFIDKIIIIIQWLLFPLFILTFICLC